MSILVTKKSAIGLMLLMLPFLLSAQVDNNEKKYYFFYEDDGQPHYNQVLNWDAVEGALSYELIILNEEGAEVFSENSEALSLEVTLKPGLYKYSVTVYNLLGKAEFRTPWIDMNIIKAEIPTITKLSPENLYIEEGDFTVTLQGENLFPDSEYWLINTNNKKIIGKLKYITFPKEGVAQINLTEDVKNPGIYTIKVLNPGGLECTAPSDYRIRYLKPFDISLSFGYNPAIPLSGDWFDGIWYDTIYPIGAIAKLDLIFLKREFGYLGLEFQGTYLSFDTNLGEAAINSEYFSGGINILYKYIFSSKIHGIVRLGGGGTYSNYSFDYEGTSGSSLESIDPYGSAGISLQYYLIRYLYLEAGVDWREFFFDSYNMGGLYPSLSMGFSY
jgi:hypothetical protein